MDSQKRILCIGEVLWDSLPMGLFLGGAPLNVSFHLHQLGEDAKIISRVGNDRLGKEAVRRIQYKKLPTDLIQQDDELETGIVEVRLDEQGNPDYEIIGPVAWDNIALTEAIKTEVSNAWALVYGSLALRNKTSRETITELLGDDTIKVFDINLRKPFFSKQIIKEYLVHADILKLNEEELHQLIAWFSLPEDEKEAIAAIADLFNCNTIVVTKGGSGAVLFHEDRWARHPGFDVTVKDAVGAGDAFLAAMLQGLRMGKDIDEMLAFANAAGAYVTSHFGATPEYTYSNVQELDISHASKDKIQ